MQKLKVAQKLQKVAIAVYFWKVDDLKKDLIDLDYFQQKICH